MSETLDLVTIGRCSVDLYGQQIGSRLEDVSTFRRAVGGCPTNIAIGTARLGLRSAVLTRVGDEAMGRFVREQLAREGVVTDGVTTDPERLTSLVLLGVRDRTNFPLIFYRDNCADSALCEADVDPGLIGRAGAVLVTGTHFATPGPAAAQHRAMHLAREAGAKVILDVDYRPNLWGLAGHGAGDSRYVRAANVTAHLAPVLAQCDLIIGTEEELHIAGGAEDTLDAIRAVRRIAPGATIVCKRGPMGCVAFEGEIPGRLEDGIAGPGFPVEVYNTLGAGDAFASGFLRGWLRGETLATACEWGNASGALAVSRLLCSTEIPSFTELCHFIAHGSTHRAVRLDRGLEHLHRATTRPASPACVMALAIDHRAQLEVMAREVDAGVERIAAFKRLALAATLRVADGRTGFGMLLDGTHGQEALFEAASHDLWIARPVEQPGSRPLAFEMEDLGGHLVAWPDAQIVKCLCVWHPDDDAEMSAAQGRALLRLQDACRTVDRRLLIEIVAGRERPLERETVARAVTQLYGLGLRPEWWKLEAQPGLAAWRAIGDAIRTHDPYCHGILALGLDAPIETFADAFAAARGEELVRGFAVGRTIFAEVAAAWFAGRIDDTAAISAMAERFARLVRDWQEAGDGREAA